MVGGSAESERSLVDRLLDISDMIVQSFDPNSEFSVWAETCRYSELLKGMALTLSNIFAGLPKEEVIIEEGEESAAIMVAPQIIFGACLAEKNKPYLEAFFEVPKFNEVLSFFNDYINMFEKIHMYFMAKDRDHIVFSPRSLAEIQAAFTPPRSLTPTPFSSSVNNDVDVNVLNDTLNALTISPKR